MVYQKTSWTNGMVISSNSLNNLEDGVSNVSFDNDVIHNQLIRVNEHLKNLTFWVVCS